MINRLLTVIAAILFCTSTAHSQQNDTCKVLLTGIAGLYDGQCKDGLANGKGTSKGDDAQGIRFDDK